MKLRSEYKLAGCRAYTKATVLVRIEPVLGPRIFSANSWVLGAAGVGGGGAGLCVCVPGHALASMHICVSDLFQLLYYITSLLY